MMSKQRKHVETMVLTCRNGVETMFTEEEEKQEQPENCNFKTKQANR